MSNLPTHQQTPEEEELARKKAELRELESRLSERELELATLQAELTAFENRYLDVVGRRYAELDGLEARIAEAMARLHPEDVSAQKHAESSRAQAEESTETVGRIAEGEPHGEFKPSEAMKALYRQAAKTVHPDLAPNEADRTRRQEFMAQINVAYSEGDEERIRAILRDWRASPESVEGGGAGAELVRVIRKIARVERRLRTVEASIEELSRGEMSQLRTKVEEAAREDRDLLARMTADLDAQIADARRRLDEIKRGD